MAIYYMHNGKVMMRERPRSIPKAVPHDVAVYDGDVPVHRCSMVDTTKGIAVVRYDSSYGYPDNYSKSLGGKCTLRACHGFIVRRMGDCLSSDKIVAPGANASPVGPSQRNEEESGG